MRKYAVVVEWTDREVSDADELPTWAKSAAEAKRKAKTAWIAAFGAQYSNCQIDRIFVLSKRMMRKFA